MCFAKTAKHSAKNRDSMSIFRQESMRKDKWPLSLASFKLFAAHNPFSFVVPRCCRVTSEAMKNNISLWAARGDE